MAQADVVGPLRDVLARVLAVTSLAKRLADRTI